MKSDCAQITIDYIAGIGIFLLSVVFVFQFMYGLFIPFESGSDKVTLTADRAATMLVEQMLRSDKSGENVIDQGKLYYFNNTKLNYSNQTAYNNALRELGLYSNEIIYDMNVSVANLTYPNNPLNQSGPPLPDNTNIGQIKRMVLVINSTTGYNETAVLSVRIW